MAGQDAKKPTAEGAVGKDKKDEKKKTKAEQKKEDEMVRSLLVSARL
jgi:hypothetical protein